MQRRRGPALTGHNSPSNQQESLVHDGEGFGIELRYWSNRPFYVTELRYWSNRPYYVIVGAGSRIPSLPNEEITPVNLTVRVGRIDTEIVESLPAITHSHFPVNESDRFFGTLIRPNRHFTLHVAPVIVRASTLRRRRNGAGSTSAQNSFAT